MIDPGGLADRKEREKREAVVTWMAITLGSIAGLGALIVWHLVRRGRLIRERLGPPRATGLPDLDPRPPRSETGR